MFLAGHCAHSTSDWEVYSALIHCASKAQYQRVLGYCVSVNRRWNHQQCIVSWTPTYTHLPRKTQHPGFVATVSLVYIGPWSLQTGGCSMRSYTMVFVPWMRPWRSSPVVSAYSHMVIFRRNRMSQSRFLQANPRLTTLTISAIQFKIPNGIRLLPSIWRSFKQLKSLSIRD